MAPTSHPRQKRRIEVDVLFAPFPQALVLDTRVSAAACRLWGVLYVFRWNDTPPDFDKLARAMGTTERSVYRWCQELEATGWIGWDRNAGILDRFVVRMNCDPDKTDTDVNSDSDELTPRSKQLTPRSKELTQVSIPALFDPALMPQTDRPSSDQNHEKIQNDDGGGGGGDDGRTLAFLIDRGIGAAHEFADLPFDQTRQDYYNRKAANQTNAIIVKAWRSNPPTKDYCYAEQPALSRSANAAAERKPSERLGERPTLPPGLKIARRHTAE